MHNEIKRVILSLSKGDTRPLIRSNDELTFQRFHDGVVDGTFSAAVGVFTNGILILGIFPAELRPIEKVPDKNDYVTICGEQFRKDITHFSFSTLYMEIDNMRELEKLQQLSQLDAVSLNGTNVNDTGLKYLGRCVTVTNINLTFTPITDEGIGHLTSLPILQHLRLKETDVSTLGIPHFNQMTSLISLQVHETEIFAKDLAEQLSLPNLKELIADCDNDEDFEALLALSKRLPECEILAKGKGTFLGGVFQG